MATVEGRKPIEQVRVGDSVKAIDPATGQLAWKRVTERHERTATAGIVRVTMEDAFGQRETLTVTQSHPYLRAANDALVGAGDSRFPPEGRAAIGAHGTGILGAVRLDPGGDWSAAGLLKPGDRVQSGRAPVARAPIGEGVDRQRQQNAAHLEVVSVEPVEVPAAKVYNLEVADHHTYA